MALKIIYLDKLLESSKAFQFSAQKGKWNVWVTQHKVLTFPLTSEVLFYCLGGFFSSTIIKWDYRDAEMI